MNKVRKAVELLRDQFPDSLEINVEYTFTDRLGQKKEGWIVRVSLVDKDIWNEPHETGKFCNLEDAVGWIIAHRTLKGYPKGTGNKK